MFYKILGCCATLLFLQITTTLACTCNKSDESFLEYIEKEHVFMAYSTNSKECNDNNKYELNLNIIDSYKGSLPRTITAYTDCATSCSFKLEEGVVYLFFTNFINNNIDFCELRIRATDDQFMRVKDYLDAIKATKLDYIEVKGAKEQVIVRAPVLNGKVNGLLQMYYPNGELRLQGMLIKGQRSGNFEVHERFETYTIIWKGDYIKGEREGQWVYKKKYTDVETPMEYALVQYEEGEEVSRRQLDKASQIELYDKKN